MLDKFEKNEIYDPRISKDKKFVKDVYTFLYLLMEDCLKSPVPDDCKMLSGFRCLGRLAYCNNHPEMLEYIENRIDKAYELYLKKDTPEGSLEFDRFKGRCLKRV